MFEDITFRSKDHVRASRTSSQLVRKYEELKKYTEIYKKSNKSTKLKLRRHKTKVLEMLHRELDKRMKPEETYEIWHDLSDVLNKNVAKKMNSNNNNNNNSRSDKNKKNKTVLLEKNKNESIIFKVNTYLEQREEEGFDASEEDHDHRYQEYDIIMGNKLNQFLNNFDSSNRLSKSKFLIESNGLEILPIEDDKDKSKSISNHHLKNLTNLLHIQIMKQNWEIAFKIFGILIRLPQVDLRSIWPLGIEILLHMNEINHGGNSWSLKVKKFFNYLASFYHLSNVNAAQNIKGNNRSNVAPVWRSGSKTLTPVYIITSLWYLFVLQDYDLVLNKVNELILEPPYNLEGVLYYIASLCWLCNGFKVVNEWKNCLGANNNLSRYQVLKELEKSETEIKKNLNKCIELQFLFPKEQIDCQLKSLFDTVNENDVDQIASSSENEAEAEAEPLVSASEGEELANGSDDLDWDAISSDSSDEGQEEDKQPVSTQLDDFNDNNYSDIEEEMEEEERERNGSIGDSGINGHSRDESGSLLLPDTQPIELADTQRIELPDTQRIEYSYDDDENEGRRHSIDNNNTGSFDTRRNSLELYSTKSSSIEPEFKRNNKLSSQQESQQTMLDFDFDFDFGSDSN